MFRDTRSIVARLLACIVFMGVSGCVSRESTCVDVAWIWQHAPKPDARTDGFTHLSEAIANYDASGGDLASAYDHLVLASNSLEWSGRPYFDNIEVTKDRFLESIKNQEGVVVEYSKLRDLLRVLSSYADELDVQGDAALKSEVGILLVRLGYQIARNGEDNLIGVLRVTIWEKGFEAMSQAGHIDRKINDNIQSVLSSQLNSIRLRDSNSTYYFCDD